MGLDHTTRNISYVPPPKTLDTSLSVKLKNNPRIVTISGNVHNISSVKNAQVSVFLNVLLTYT